MAGNGKKVGVITHYYTKLGVGIVKLTADLKVGDNVRFEGVKTKFEQPIKEMELDHKKIEVAKKGQEVGVKLVDRVREKDKVLLLGQEKQIFTTLFKTTDFSPGQVVD